MKKRTRLWRTFIYLIALADAIFALYLVTCSEFVLGFIVFWIAPLLILDEKCWEEIS